MGCCFAAFQPPEYPLGTVRQSNGSFVVAVHKVVIYQISRDMTVGATSSTISLNHIAEVL